MLNPPLALAETPWSRYHGWREVALQRRKVELTSFRHCSWREVEGPPLQLAVRSWEAYLIFIDPYCSKDPYFFNFHRSMLLLLTCMHLMIKVLAHPSLFFSDRVVAPDMHASHD
jgi:hypothetical protein